MATVSIITPNLNSGAKLAATIDSVARQNADFEHILVDGGSTDSSGGIARDFAAARDTRVRLVSDPDGGVYDAMNRGVGLARGRYIYFLGAGDVLVEGVLREITARLPEHDRGFVYGDVLWDGRRYDGPFGWRKLVAQNICHQSIFFGREVFTIKGLFDLRYPMLADWEMNLRCFGDRRIEKVYVPMLIAEYEGGGLSLRQKDVNFGNDMHTLVRRHLGLGKYCYIRASLLKRNLESLVRPLLRRWRAPIRVATPDTRVTQE